MQYDYEELDILCEQVDLLEYASKSFNFVKKDFHNWACHCPLHIDKTPSLMIDDSGNYFYCFSCGVSGNIISWLRVFENLSFNEAVQKTAKLANADLTSLQSSDTIAFYKKLRKSRQEKEKIQREILSPDYFDQFSDEIPIEWVEEGIPEDTLKKYEIKIDKRSNRIVYPVYDNNLNLIGAKGRTRFKNFKQLHIMKYMNYTKLQAVDFFAGMKQASINKKIIIFEGIKSVMKADSWGYHNCVSAETSKINDDQIRLLIRLGVKEVIIAFDKDVKMSKIGVNTQVLRRFTNVSVIYDKHDLLDEKDAPVDKGKEVFEKLLEERMML